MPHYENVPFEVPKGWDMVSVLDLFLLNPKSELDDNMEVGFICRGGFFRKSFF